MKINASWKHAASLVLLFAAQSAFAQETVTINFDGTGAEAGITGPGTGDFTFMGSSWTGGENRSQGVGALYASGAYSFHADVPANNNMATVVFDPPVTDVEFFYVHGAATPAGSAEAFNGSGGSLGTIATNSATFFGDPANFVSFDTNEPIAMIQFNGGAVDNFSYTAAAGGFDFQMVEGSWLNPEVTGSGILFDYGASLNQMFVTWVTHTVDRMTPVEPAADEIGFAGHRWVNALLDLEGNVASGDMFVVEGGQFDTPPNATQRSRVLGHITVTFNDCNSGTFEYTFDAPVNRSGSFDIVQLEGFVSPTFVCGDMAAQ